MFYWRVTFMFFNVLVLPKISHALFSNSIYLGINMWNSSSALENPRLSLIYNYCIYFQRSILAATSGRPTFNRLLERAQQHIFDMFHVILVEVDFISLLCTKLKARIYSLIILEINNESSCLVFQSMFFDFSFPIHWLFPFCWPNLPTS